MRRWLALFLFVMLPLQFSWSAVAAYCAHDGPAATAHQALHHPDGADGHDHAGPPAPPDDATPPTADGPPGASTEAGGGSGHEHHHHCHGHCLALPEVALSAPVLGAAQARCLPPDAGAVGHVAARPERPQWARLA